MVARGGRRNSLESEPTSVPEFVVASEKHFAREAKEPAVNRALEDLAEACNRAHGWFAACLNVLTDDDIVQALGGLNFDGLRFVYRPLEIWPQPRKPTSMVTAKVVSQLRSANGYRGSLALAALTQRAWASIVAATFPDYLDDVRRAESQRVVPIDRWSSAILRAALWSCLRSSPGHARLLLWANEQGWLVPDGVEQPVVDGILRAAQNVIDETPHFHPYPRRTLPVADSAAPRPTKKPHLEEHSRDADDQTDNVTQESPSEHDPAGEVDSVSTDKPVPVDLAELTHEWQHCTEHVLPRIASSFDAGVPPAAEDLASLQEVVLTFDLVKSQLVTDISDAGLKASAPRSLDDLKSLADQLVAHESGREQREQMKRIANLQYSGPSDAVSEGLQTLQTIAATLADSAIDTTDQQFQALNALRQLVMLSSSMQEADPEHAGSLQMQISATFPEHAPVAIAAMMGHITIDRHAVTDTARVDAAAGDNSPTAKHEPEPSVVAPVAPADDAATGAVADTSDTPSTTGKSSEPDAVTSGLVALLGDERYGAAAAVASAAGYSTQFASALSFAEVAERVRFENKACAARVRTELADLDIDMTGDDPLTLLVLAPALVRTAFIVGDPLAGTHLQAIESVLQPGLMKFVDEIAQRAVKGVFSSGVLAVGNTPATELEQRVSQGSAQARELLTRKQRLPRHRKAADILSRWLDGGGILNTLLATAADDKRGKAQDVAAQVERLSKADTVLAEIRATDSLSRPGRKSLDATSLADLLSSLHKILEPVSEWALGALTLSRRSSEDSYGRWINTEVSVLRETVRSRRDAVLDTLTELADTPTDPVLAAAAAAARKSLAVSVSYLLEGTGIDGLEPPYSYAGEIDLLRVPDVRVKQGGPVTLAIEPSPSTLLSAFDTSWTDAFAAHVSNENYPAAHAIVELLSLGIIPSADGSINDQALQTSIARSREDLSRWHDELSVQLRLARRQNQLSEEQDADLFGRLSDADPNDTGRSDLMDVRAAIQRISQQLPSFRDEAVDRIRDRLSRVQSPDPQTVDTINNLLAKGELSVAEELIYFLEAGEALPEYRARDDFSTFFPAVPDALPHGITKSLLTAVTNGRQFNKAEALDYTGLSSDARHSTAAALKNWMMIRDANNEGRWKIRERDLLIPVLRILGYEANRVQRHDDLARSSDRRFIEFEDIRVNGRAMVPAFGSKLNGRLRVLLVWGKPSEEQVLSWAAHDTGDSSLAVFYFGTLSSDARRRLAARAASTAEPIIIVDDAAVAYLAAQGEGQLDATMSITLPFASVNPYVNVRKGLVAPEMFYGRIEERRDVLNPEATHVLYGGRGLGKSALLRASAQRFEEEAHSAAIYLDLNAVGFGTGQPANAVWDSILSALQDNDIITTGNGRTRSKDSYTRVRDGVKTWLSSDSRNRLLILLDESDRFFEADAPRFTETNRLKLLGQELDNSTRVKTVFAGLHTVQRFANVNSNGPFSHLGTPTVIGPLNPQGAFDLIARPLAALGYRWEDLDLINRALTYASYQPFLLQMLGYRLVELLRSERIKAGVNAQEPPYYITREHLEAVEADPDLKADIHTAFTDTLNLDPRYSVIANVLAHNAYEHGTEARLSDTAMRSECQDHWPAGFDGLPVERFRAYLHEMVGLGVLAPKDGRGWRLRSPNTLRMIGSSNDVVEQLLTAAEASVPEEFIALETRHALPGGVRHSPLTARQITDLLGDHANQVRVVVGSDAMCIADAPAAIRSTCEGLGARFTLCEPRTNKQFRDEIIAGNPGERRVILSHLRRHSTESIRNSLGYSLEMLPARGVTRSVVLIFGPEDYPSWAPLLMDDDSEIGFVNLNRHDARTLKVWSINTNKFTTPDRRNALFEATSGWPSLVEQAAELTATINESRAVKAIQDQLRTRNGAQAFVASTGITINQDLTDLFGQLVDLLDEPVSEDDLFETAEMTGVANGATLVRTLIALGVFNIQNGQYSVDALLSDAWMRR